MDTQPDNDSIKFNSNKCSTLCKFCLKRCCSANIHEPDSIYYHITVSGVYIDPNDLEKALQSRLWIHSSTI